MVVFDCSFLTQENADTSRILICRGHVCGQTGVTGFEWKGPTACQIPLLFELIKDLESLRIILKDENVSSLKVFQNVTIYSFVEVLVREMKRQCRDLRISAEHNTSVGITDDISLPNWIPHFAMQFLNKMRRTGRRWRQSVAQLGKEEPISFVKCTIQGILVSHHDRTKAISCIIKSGIVRGKSRTKQNLSDAWESTIKKDLCGIVGCMQRSRKQN